MASFKEALSKVILNLFLFSVHIAPNFFTAINCFNTEVTALNKGLINH